MELCLNAALAIQLSTYFLANKFPQLLSPEINLQVSKSKVCRVLSSAHILGLKETIWQGRFQVQDFFGICFNF
jgi:hypothetical protein